MSRTFKKDKFGKTSTQYKSLAYKCRCEFCLNEKYKNKKQLRKVEIIKIINDTNNNIICSNAIGI